MSDPAVTTAWVRAFIDELVRAGVEHVCVAPGSRSTPLVMACARADGIRMWVHLDERCAAFFALGIGKITRRPAAVITTSGTATANLFPAVVEASQAGVPLLLLTADRPVELRGTDANQTIDQSNLYGSFVRETLDAGEPSVDGLRGVRVLACGAVAATLGDDPGPVHVNFPLDKPLEPAELSAERAASLRTADPEGLDGRADGAPMVPVVELEGVIDAKARAVAKLLVGGPGGLIVVGPVSDPEAVGSAVGALARATGFPVLADPLSGARFSAHCAEYAVTSYDLFLREHPLGDMSHPESALRDVLNPDLVCRIGGAPTSAALLAYLGGLGDVPQVRITSVRGGRDHLGVASIDVQSDVASFVRAVSAELSAPGVASTEPRTEPSTEPPTDSIRSAWLERWRGIDRTAQQAVCDFESSGRGREGNSFEGEVLAGVVAGVPEGTILFVSNSMPVRDLDAFGGGGKPLRVCGNRGASGIDGIVSTVAGIAAASDVQSPMVAVLGDVALYHDMNGLLVAAKHELNVVFVVINNDGGGIFHMLPIRDHEPEFTQYFAAPHGLDFRHAAELYGIPYRRVEQTNGAADAFREVFSSTGPRILEVVSDRDQNHRSRQAVVEAVHKAVTALL